MELPPTFDVDVVARDVPSDTAEYARNKIGGLGRHTHRPVLHARVKLAELRDPAVERPVTAQANIDVDGRLVRAQVQGTTAHEAIDRLEAKLRERLQRLDGRLQARRPASTAEAHEWRHESEPTHRPSYFPRRAEERRIIRRKSFALAPCTVDEAADEMDLLDYDFHLFTEQGTGSAAILYRGGPTGYRLALVTPTLTDGLIPGRRDVGISGHPAPCITEEEAADRLGLLGLPFVFFIDAAHGRVSVIYRRYDGHYGVITPAEG